MTSCVGLDQDGGYRIETRCLTLQMIVECGIENENLKLLVSVVTGL